MKQIGALKSLRSPHLIQFIQQLFLTPTLWLGIFSSAISFAMFLWLLSWTDLSFAVPAMALVYVCGTFGARFILHERVTQARWIGSLFICIGVALISLD
jgi:drug/metabolite transporter (DMT)-like permease